MGAMIAVGAIGLAGGIMGGIMGGQAEEAAFLAQKAEVERNNFFGAMAHDRQTEQTANANVNSKIRDEKVTEAAIANSFYANYKTAQQYTDNKSAIYQQSRAAQATMKSQMMGKGTSSGGTADALARQAQQAERNAYHSASVQKFDKEEQAEQQFNNALSQRDMGISHSSTNAFFPGTTGIQPSGSGAMMNGIFGGLSSGISMASSVNSMGGGPAPAGGTPAPAGG
tara:strand:- start:14133 stop:14810 length:678 start_codon:yes stop_codon:yes gene_type:complete